ncbi:hypothetical protein HK096_006187, partial [Nowakowskiella sp. JEL0078]
ILSYMSLFEDQQRRLTIHNQYLSDFTTGRVNLSMEITKNMRKQLLEFTNIYQWSLEVIGTLVFSVGKLRLEKNRAILSQRNESKKYHQMLSDIITQIKPYQDLFGEAHTRIKGAIKDIDSALQGSKTNINQRSTAESYRIGLRDLGENLREISKVLDTEEYGAKKLAEDIQNKNTIATHSRITLAESYIEQLLKEAETQSLDINIFAKMDELDRFGHNLDSLFQDNLKKLDFIFEKIQKAPIAENTFERENENELISRTMLEKSPVSLVDYLHNSIAVSASLKTFSASSQPLPKILFSNISPISSISSSPKSQAIKLSKSNSVVSSTPTLLNRIRDRFNLFSSPLNPFPTIQHTHTTDQVFEVPQFNIVKTIIAVISESLTTMGGGIDELSTIEELEDIQQNISQEHLTHILSILQNKNEQAFKLQAQISDLQSLNINEFETNSSVDESLEIGSKLQHEDTAFERTQRRVSLLNVIADNDEDTELRSTIAQSGMPGLIITLQILKDLVESSARSEGEKNTLQERIRGLRDSALSENIKGDHETRYEFETIITGLKNEVNMLQTDLERRVEDFEILEHRFIELKVQKDHLEEKNRKEIESIHEENNRLERVLSNLENSYSVSGETWATKEIDFLEEIESLKDLIITKDLYLSGVRQAYDSRISKMMEEQQSVLNRINKLQDHNSIIEKTNQSLREQHIEEKNKFSKLEADLKRSTNEIDLMAISNQKSLISIKNELNSSQNLFEREKSKNENLQSIIIPELEEKIMILKKRIEEGKSAAEDIEHKFSSDAEIYLKENTALETRLKEVDAQLNASIRENSRWKEAMDQEFVKLKSEKDHFRAERDQLAEMLQEQKFEIVDLKSTSPELNKIVSQNAEYVLKIEHLKKVVNSKDEFAMQIENQYRELLDTSSTESNNLRLQIISLKNELVIVQNKVGLIKSDTLTDIEELQRSNGNLFVDLQIANAKLEFSRVELANLTNLKNAEESRQRDTATRLRQEISVLCDLSGLSFRNTNDIRTEEIVELSKKVTAINLALTESERQISIERAANESRILELTHKFEDTNENLHEAQIGLDELETRCTHLRSQIFRLESTLETVKSDNQTIVDLIRAECEKLRKENKILQSQSVEQISFLKSEVSRVSQNIVDTEKEKTKLESDLQLLREQKTLLEKDLTSSNRQNREMEDNLLAKTTSWRNENEKIQDDLRIAHERIFQQESYLEAKLNDLMGKSDLDLHEVNSSEVPKTIPKIFEKNSQLEGRLSVFEEIVRQKEAREKDLQSKMDDLKSKIHTLETNDIQIRNHYSKEIAYSKETLENMMENEKSIKKEFNDHLLECEAKLLNFDVKINEDQKKMMSNEVHANEAHDLRQKVVYLELQCKNLEKEREMLNSMLMSSQNERMVNEDNVKSLQAEIENIKLEHHKEITELLQKANNILIKNSDIKPDSVKQNFNSLPNIIKVFEAEQAEIDKAVHAAKDKSQKDFSDSKKEWQTWEKRLTERIIELQGLADSRSKRIDELTSLNKSAEVRSKLLTLELSTLSEQCVERENVLQKNLARLTDEKKVFEEESEKTIQKLRKGIVDSEKLFESVKEKLDSTLVTVENERSRAQGLESRIRTFEIMSDNSNETNGVEVGPSPRRSNFLSKRILELDESNRLLKDQLRASELKLKEFDLLFSSRRRHSQAYSASLDMSEDFEFLSHRRHSRMPPGYLQTLKEYEFPGLTTTPGIAQNITDESVGRKSKDESELSPEHSNLLEEQNKLKEELQSKKDALKEIQIQFDKLKLVVSSLHLENSEIVKQWSEKANNLQSELSANLVESQTFRVAYDTESSDLKRHIQLLNLSLDASKMELKKAQENFDIIDSDFQKAKISLANHESERLKTFTVIQDQEVKLKKLISDVDAKNQESVELQNYYNIIVKERDFTIQEKSNSLDMLAKTQSRLESEILKHVNIIRNLENELLQAQDANRKSSQIIREIRESTVFLEQNVSSESSYWESKYTDFITEADQNSKTRVKYQCV